MKNNIKGYIDTIFKNVTVTRYSEELKEELTANLLARYEDNIASGMSENEAFNDAIISIGDVNELIASIAPDEKFVEEKRMYQTRNAKWMAIAIGLYIICAIPVIIGGFNGSDMAILFGVSITLIIVAIATGILIYISNSTPSEYKDESFGDQEEEQRYNHPAHGIYWICYTAFYLIISWLTGAWAITWMLWVVSPIGSILINMFLEKKEN